jgi:WD40 repeat protein
VAGNSLICSDYLAGGHTFAVAGKDRKVYLYDADTNKLQAEIYKNGFSKIQTHNNRVFSLKGHSEDANILVSSGWDSQIKIYDIRQATPVASIGVGKMAGDSLDIYDDMIVAGCYQNRSNMNVLSLKHMCLVDTFNYSQQAYSKDSGFLLSSRFTNDGQFIISGGAGKN